MQISPIPTLDDETNQIREMTAKNVAQDVISNEHLKVSGHGSTERRPARLLHLPLPPVGPYYRSLGG
jgi:hypothetical protein